jgi:hypothetical protein
VPEIAESLRRASPGSPEATLVADAAQQGRSASGAVAHLGDANGANAAKPAPGLNIPQFNSPSSLSANVNMPNGAMATTAQVPIPSMPAPPGMVSIGPNMYSYTELPSWPGSQPQMQQPRNHLAHSLL